MKMRFAALLALLLPFPLAAQNVVQAPVVAPVAAPISVVPAGSILPVGPLSTTLSGASLIPNALTPTLALPSALALPKVAVQTQIAPVRAENGQRAVAAVQAAPSANLQTIQQAQTQAQTVEKIQTLTQQVNKALELPGNRENAASEASRDSAEKSFSALRGEKLISAGDAPAAAVEAAAGAPATLLDVAGAARAENSRRAASLLKEAKALVYAQFQGFPHLGGRGRFARGSLDGVLEKAKTLTGRSAVYLEAPTAAGKSTLAESLKGILGERIKVFPVDNYFKSWDRVPKGPDGQLDFDQPGSLDLDLVARDIKTLLAGGRIELPAYDMATGKVTPKSGQFLQLGARDVLIVDSIYASHEKLLKASEGRQSLNVFLYAPASVRLARRLKRDIVQRGIPAERNLNKWPTILLDEKQFIMPLMGQADFVLDLMSEEELRQLPAAYAQLLADEWAARGKTPETTRLFLSRIKASLEADKALARR
ncbi:MAG TPA: hypothetical protein DCM05_09800 [Elusimicrobia bacterium]|nr:hypothetical protein [Elusimicrobiota bacterium]